MSISLKWQIQLWHALVLGLVLGVLGVSFYYYEKQHRLATIDQQLDQHIHAVLSPLMRPLQYRPPRPKSTEAQAKMPENVAPSDQESYSGGWVRRKSLRPGSKSGKMQGGSRLSRHEDFEKIHVPNGFYVSATRQHADLSFTSSNYPNVPFPDETLRGYFIRERDGRYREHYYERPEFRVLVGYDLAYLHQGLRNLQLAIAGGALFLFVAGLIIGSCFVSRSLRPLHAIETTSSRIAQGKLTERITLPSPNDATELQRLAGQLNATFAQLEASFQRQIRFTADASHELRTPLTALMAQLELGLKCPRKPDAYERILRICQRSGARIQRITEQLIELSHFDSGRVELDIETIAIDAMLTALCEELQPYIEAHGSVLHLDCEPGEIACDPFRLEQAISNLINNALQHNEQPVEITLRARKENAGMLIEVIDNGVGIQPENLDKLFDRFFQESTSRVKDHGNFNVGLGLSIAKAITDAHRGQLTAKSIPNVETCFSIRLPLFN